MNIQTVNQNPESPNPMDIQTSCPSVPTDLNQCVMCADDIDPLRVEILKANDKPLTCLWCGEEQARQERKLWCIAPLSNKAAYTLITDRELLKQLNPKRTTT